MLSIFLKLFPVRLVVSFSSCFFLVLLLCYPLPSYALSIIRDTEIEYNIKQLARPIFAAAQLAPENVQFYLIQNDDINAFVSGGQNIFFYTGLLRQSEQPYIFLGVLAHEVGHIVGGHAIKNADAYKNITFQSTLGYVLGLAAAAAGSPSAGMAIAAGTQHATQRSILKYTRSNEESADQAALSYLDQAQISSRGLLTLLKKMHQSELTQYGQMDPYILTHPLSVKRINHIENHLRHSPYADHTLATDTLSSYRRAIVKLDAFIAEPEETLRKYPPSDTTLFGYYARAIAYHKMPDITLSLQAIDTLLKRAPKDAYFNELKGQILYENGHIAQAIPYYQKALDLMPSAPLLKIQLATSQIAAGGESQIQDAIIHLKQALMDEKDSPHIWRQLAIAYGKDHQIGLSNLALAEEAMLKKDSHAARRFLTLAKPYIVKDTSAYIRMHDLLLSIERLDDD